MDKTIYVGLPIKAKIITSGWPDGILSKLYQINLWQIDIQM